MGILNILVGWWALSILLPPIYINGSWFMKDIAGMTLAPFIFYRKKGLLNSQRFRKHEETHIHQQRLMSPLVFLIVYIVNYLINRLHSMTHFEAYYNILLEVSARKAEKE